ncbi:MAG: molybdopterin-dependent oxidoreductase [Acidobacteriota bacterium]
MATSRRNFIVGAAGAGIGFGLGAFSHQFPLASPHFGPDWEPGEETFVPSTCLLCPAHCGIRARLMDGRPTRIDGNPLHPVSQGGLCPKGRAGIQLLYHPGRLKGPMQRVGPPGSEEFEPISWDQALDRIAAALRAARPRAGGAPVEWIVGGTTGVMGELIAGFSRAQGASSLTVDDYRDGAADVLGLCQGIASPPAYDLAAADLVLSFGAALSEAWWAQPLAAGARVGEAGHSPRWVQADTRLSRSAVAADEWVPVKPGSYGTLALGLAYVIVKEGLYDPNALARQVSGWEDWTDEAGTLQPGFRALVLRHGRPDEVSARAGVPIARLTALAKSFGSARAAVAVWDQAVAWRTGGLADALAIHALNILTNRLNRPGGILVQPPLPTLPGPLEHWPGAVEDLAKAPLTSNTWPADAEAGQSPADVLFLYYADPVASAPDSVVVTQALARVPLVVSFSPFFDESARYASLLMPDHTYLERWQDGCAPPAVPFPVWGVTQPVARPLLDTRASGDVLLDLARRLGGDFAPLARWASVEDLVRSRGLALAAEGRGSAFVERFRQRELRELEGRGWWLPHGQSTEAYWETILGSGGWFDPIYDYHDGSSRSQYRDGRVWIFPAEARKRLRQSGGQLAGGFLPAAGTSGTPAAEEFPLLLVPFRVMTLASGSTPLMPWLLEHLGVLNGDGWETWIDVNPETAREHGLRSGQRVRVESVHGGFEATVRLFSGAQPGVVNVPYGLHARVDGWGEARGANPLAAIGRRVDSVSGMPDWYSTRVRLVRF